MKDRMWGTPKSRDRKKESDRWEDTPENLELLRHEEQQGALSNSCPEKSGWTDALTQPVPLVVRSHTF